MIYLDASVVLAQLFDHGQRVELASYDARLLAAARAVEIPVRRL